jgi:hypothetical protein
MQHSPWEVIVVQLVNKFPALYGMWKFITVLARDCHWSLFWATWIQSTPSTISLNHWLTLPLQRQMLHSYDLSVVTTKGFQWQPKEYAMPYLDFRLPSQLQHKEFCLQGTSTSCMASECFFILMYIVVHSHTVWKTEGLNMPSWRYFTK